VQPGVVNLRLQERLAGLGLFFPPDPSSQIACTLGGNARQTRAARTVSNTA